MIDQNNKKMVVKMFQSLFRYLLQQNNDIVLLVGHDGRKKLRPHGRLTMIYIKAADISGLYLF